MKPNIPIKIYGSEILRQNCAPVTFPNPDLERIIMSMFVVMYRMGGVGLSANQVGVPERIAVINIDPAVSEAEQIILINPEIIKTSETQTEGEEGCLSIPGVHSGVKRFDKITVRNTDLKGEQYEFEAEDLLAVAIQHEMDHLSGKLFIDYVQGIHRNLFENKLKKIARATKRGEQYQD
jgi:peptide deformylase